MTGPQRLGLPVDTDGNYDPAGLPQDVRDLGFTDWHVTSRVVGGRPWFVVALVGGPCQVRGHGDNPNDAYHTAIGAARGLA